jgi:photosystem II stability/assembly factor-like uncharacterized protein
MKKFLILVLGLSLTAASCNLFGSSGAKGVMKSEDGGETYSVANKLEGKGDISKISVNSMALDPNDGDIVYVGSASGVHRTQDGGKTWKLILTGGRVGDIAVDASATNIVYAAGISGENGRLLKTTDTGETWKDIYTEPSKSNPVLSVAISRANAKILLAGLNSGEVIRSIDEGITWQIVRDFGNAIIDIEYTDSSTAYVLTQTSGLFKSADQGSSWTPVEVKVQTEGSTTVRLPTTRTFYDAAFDQRLKGVIFLASAQGLLRSVDSGTTWQLMSLPVINQTLNVSAVAINPTNSNNLLIAVGSTIFKSTNGGVTWETKKLSTQQRVKQIIINPDEPNKIYLGMGDN